MGQSLFKEEARSRVPGGERTLIVRPTSASPSRNRSRAGRKPTASWESWTCPDRFQARKIWPNSATWAVSWSYEHSGPTILPPLSWYSCWRLTRYLNLRRLAASPMTLGVGAGVLSATVFVFQLNQHFDRVGGLDAYVEQLITGGGSNLTYGLTMGVPLLRGEGLIVNFSKMARVRPFRDGCGCCQRNTCIRAGSHLGRHDLRPVDSDCLRARMRSLLRREMLEAVLGRRSGVRPNMFTALNLLLYPGGHCHSGSQPSGRRRAIELSETTEGAWRRRA